MDHETEATGIIGIIQGLGISGLGFRRNGCANKKP